MGTRETTDGFFLEYVFAKSSSKTVNTRDYPHSSCGTLIWRDSAPELDADQPYLFRSHRQVEDYFAENTSNVDAQWSTPELIKVLK